MTGFLQEETERFRKALQDIDGDMIKVIHILQQKRWCSWHTQTKVYRWITSTASRRADIVAQRQLSCLVSCSAAAIECICNSLSALLAPASQEAAFSSRRADSSARHRLPALPVSA